MNSINSFCGFSHSDKISKCSRFFPPTKSFTRVNSIHSDFWKIVFRCLSKYDMWYGVFVMEKVTIAFSSRCDNVWLGCNFHSDNLQWTSMQYVYCEMLQKVVCNNRLPMFCNFYNVACYKISSGYSNWNSWMKSRSLNYILD